jgi:phosphoserine phosphatase RsbU/P
MNASSPSNQKVFRTLKDDLGQGGLSQTVRRDFDEFREFMLTDEAKQRLRAMRPLKRWIVTAGWLLKSLFFKLTPSRRILFVTGIVLLFVAQSDIRVDERATHISINTGVLGVVIIIFVLGLELKDKLLAHEELKAGQMVQQALMPERNPGVPGWDLWLYSRSANDVGGDLVDFLRLNNERFGVAIGDVAGKGLRAALLSAKLQATLRAVATDYTSLSELGKKLNQIYARDGLKTMFASLAYAEIDSNSGHVRVVNAGHLRPIHLFDRISSHLEKGGPALGVLPDASYKEQAVILKNGEALILYSDGLIEAQNALGEFYGETRFVNLLPNLVARSAGEMGERIVADVDQFIGDSRIADDLSLVIVKKIS